MRAHGSGIQVYELQGNLALSTTEVVVHDAMADLASVDTIVIDFKHTLSLNESAGRLFHQLLLKYHERGKHVVFTNTARIPQLRRLMKAKLAEQFGALFRSFDDIDAALEWSENRLLNERMAIHLPDHAVAPADYELFASLNPEEITVLQSLLHRRKFARGKVIVEFGAPAGELFFLARGRASVTVPLSGGTQKRLATFSPGMAFGEMAMLDRAPRSAAVTADTEVECDLLKLEDFDRLGESHPHIKIVLLRNLALGLSQKLRKANREISVFD